MTILNEALIGYQEEFLIGTIDYEDHTLEIYSRFVDEGVVYRIVWREKNANTR